MKKFSFISSVFVLSAVVGFLFIGCHKEATTTEENIAVSENTNITTTAGTSTISGIISQDHAVKMSDAFATKYPDVVTKSVGYSTKNLIAYLTTLLVKYKSDSVFVGFGLYDKITAPKPSYVGVNTIFFMGKGLKSSSGNVRLQTADKSDMNSSNYLNNGNVLPPPSEESSPFRFYATKPILAILYF